ncbi:MAG: hypothetical protein WAN35_16355 [Terracidiphilus sp.]
MYIRSKALILNGSGYPAGSSTVKGDGFGGGAHPPFDNRTIELLTSAKPESRRLMDFPCSQQPQSASTLHKALLLH